MGQQHTITQNATGLSQPQGSNDHTTAAGCIKDAPCTKQTLTDGQDTITNAYINATDQTPGHKLNQMLQNTPNAKQTLTDGRDTTKT